MLKPTFELPQLESHLWESANILRGPVDAADFKTYIFPLLFFKRICDIWDDEYQEIVDETGDEQLACFPESHRFQIPVLANGANLSIPQYVKRTSGKSTGNADGQPATLPAAWEQWQAASAPFWQQMDALVDTLDGLADQESPT